MGLRFEVTDLEKKSHVELLKIYRKLDSCDDDDAYLREVIQNICEKIQNASYPRLECCQMMKDSASVVFRASISSDDKTLGWVVVCSDFRQPELHDVPYFGTLRHPAKFCPYCGKGVPAFRRKKILPKPIIKNLGDQYCGTCKERLMHCLCLPEEASYELV